MMSKPITGRGYFLIFAIPFGVILAVNLTLAFNATRTFPGLETDNSYVVSQQFDKDRAAQEALGWTVDAQVHGGELVLSITDEDGAPAELEITSAIFGRPTNVTDDQEPAFVFDGEVFRAPVVAGDGNWNLRLRAVAADGTDFRQRVVVLVD